MAGVAVSNSALGVDVRSSVRFVVCCKGIGFCDEVIIRSEEPYCLCVCVCVCVCVIEKTQNWAA